MPGLPRRGAAPSTSTEPVVSAVSPSATRRSDVLPEPLGPRTATKLPCSNVSDSSRHTSWPPYARVARSKRMAGAVTISATLLQRGFELVHLGQLPLDERVVLRRHGLGDADDRD